MPRLLEVRARHAALVGIIYHTYLPNPLTSNS